jgi:hypothetical protein
MLPSKLKSNKESKTRVVMFLCMVVIVILTVFKFVI